MPLFEYTCEKCHADFELLLYGQEQPVCPDCGGRKLAKRFSVPAAHVSSGNLPLAPGGGCGRPQCGSGGCQGM
ncbi:MAG TPA: zinc ribbon domain-containing protein [Pirellulales bacterium]|jgi:putative FmdB family regulatory protein|nr:zinc ribbon domain-containing protein [Pirellulales bacterium]